MIVKALSPQEAETKPATTPKCVMEIIDTLLIERCDEPEIKIFQAEIAEILRKNHELGDGDVVRCNFSLATYEEAGWDVCMVPAWWSADVVKAYYRFTRKATA